MLLSYKSKSDETVHSLAELFGILSDPTRLRILFVLHNSELPVGAIAQSVGMSVSAISHQLRLLKTLKIVKHRKQGKHAFYSLDDQHIEQLIAMATEHVEE